MDLTRQSETAVLAASALALEQWAQRVGRAGMAAMHALPALHAAVDQHVAHIRAVVADSRGRVHPATLAAYADGVADTVSARGWTARETTWERPSWPSVHLLAVCVLAEACMN
ncbi:DUF6401 family natural product biosynthesis protein [Actinoplanes sp. Pm04-4]|uniref:DUF6401 family natural product biosynthesis protein n=1 Tax=Paractinoplanes pyxinae TaxID=2997416 RepID=A0ABT4B109_9ACTN|nr:DUF6401 family natural product biosynthesis protein [Actinoplanes pyxinae]MCY1139365.1 DUF6401 family natural product biosynthesis protein [Actinoplanes pyxinae]